MRITIFSGYLNAHMLPLCEELRAHEGVELSFVALSPHPGNVGRENLSDATPWVVRAYEDELQAARAVELAQNDDVVIFGHMGGHEGFVESRVAAGKLTFRAAERILKRGSLWRFFPPKAKRTHEWFGRYASCDNFHMLCIGGQAANDLVLSGFPLEKCLQWGYFTEVPEELERTYSSQDEPLQVLWAARMLPYKRSADAPAVIADLVASGVPVHLVMAGDGEDMPLVRQAVEDWGIEDSVDLLGIVSPERLDQLMRKADVVLNTCGRKEGWGAAMGEAMARGCVLVSSADAGAASALVRDGENGFLFPDGRLDAAESCLSWLAADRARVRATGEAARRTMLETWNARVAAANFLALSEALLAGEEPPVLVGPCSPCRIGSGSRAGGAS